VRQLAEVRGVTPAQLALAWLLHQGDHVVTIPGTRSIHRFDENQRASGVRLGADDLAFLDAHLPVGAASGARY
jgi:aryl-alcohol dehydrogenase-like predicted oxidoreductase